MNFSSNIFKTSIQIIFHSALYKNGKFIFLNYVIYGWRLCYNVTYWHHNPKIWSFHYISYMILKTSCWCVDGTRHVQHDSILEYWYFILVTDNRYQFLYVQILWIFKFKSLWVFSHGSKFYDNGMLIMKDYWQWKGVVI